MDLFDKIEKYGRDRYGIEIAYKDESKFMQLLGKLLFFNKRFMTSYTTTISDTVYFPSRDSVKQNRDTAALVLGHELQHVNDAHKMTFPIFALMYLSPQIFALLAILAIWFSPLWLLALVCLLPIPSPGRTVLELHGYAVSTVLIRRWCSWRADCVSQFTTSAYYWMWPFSSPLINFFSKWDDCATSWAKPVKSTNGGNLLIDLTAIVDEHLKSVSKP